MDPFASLPPPSNPATKKRERDEQDAAQVPHPSDTKATEAEKRAKLSSVEEKGPDASAGGASVEATPAQIAAAHAQLTAAIRKIASHIGSPKKFVKAAALLKKLLEEGNVEAAHGRDVFEALKQGMNDTSLCMDPNLRREYRDLYVLAQQKGRLLFTMRQRAQLQTWVDYCVQRNQTLTTDDSFTFSRACTNLRQSIDELMPIEEGEAAEWDAWRKQSAVSAEDEAMQRDQGAAGPSDGEDLGGAYSDLQMLSSRREYLLDFLESLKSVKHKWAMSSVELTWEHAYKQKDKFLPGDQQGRIDKLYTALKEQGTKKGGAGAGGDGRDLTAFEKNERVWAASATVSKRGALGNDNVRSAQYLG